MNSQAIVSGVCSRREKKIGTPDRRLEMTVPLLRPRYCAGCLHLFFRDLFIILSQFLAGSCSVKMSQAFHDPSISFHRTWER